MPEEGKPLTKHGPWGILKLDGDNLLSYHYCRDGWWHRKPLFRVDGNNIRYLDPGTKAEVEIGYVIRPLDHLMVCVFRHVT